MKISCLYFDKKYKCVSFIVHYKGLTLNKINTFSTLYMHFISVVYHISAILPIISNYHISFYLFN